MKFLTVCLLGLLVPIACLGDNSTGAEKTFSLPNGAKMVFVWIEPGTFQMGSPDSEVGRNQDEGPVREVKISQGFYLGKYEVTQGQWEAVMGSRPPSKKDDVLRGPSHPAVNISWKDVQSFIEELNVAAGGVLYRLPTEAEWEYACRAGTTTRWPFGDDESQLTDYAWYSANGWSMSHAVGLKKANPWGLYDMNGNVWEWVQDWYTVGSTRVIRGGDFRYDAQGVRSAARANPSPDARHLGVGVRLLRIR